MGTISPIFAAFLLAAIVEGVMEHFVANQVAIKQQGPLVLQGIAAVLGVVLAVAFGVDLLGTFGLHSTLPVVGPYVGSAATGLVLGRGSNFLHDFMGQFAPGVTLPPEVSSK